MIRIDWDRAENLCRDYVSERGSVSSPYGLLSYIQSEMSLSEDEASATLFHFIDQGPLYLTNDWKLVVNDGV